MYNKIARYSVVALSIVFLNVGVFAQAGGKPPTGGGPSTPTRPTVPTTPTQPQQQPQQMQRPVFIMGDVITGDGTPIPTNIEIHRVCSGRDRREAYADSSGHFSFQLGSETVMQDASSDFGSDFPGRPQSMGGIGMATQSSFGGSQQNQLFGCELKAVVPGYRSSSLELSTFRQEEPIVGKLVIERFDRVQGTMISATSAAAPKDAQKAYKKGMDLARKGKLDEAQVQFNDAVKLYPRYAEAWLQVGRIYQHENQPDNAKNAFQQAISADPKFVAPYVNLAGIEAMHQNWQEAARLSDQAITLDPVDFPNGYFMSSVAHFNMGHMDVAEKSARKAATLDGQHRLPQIQSLLGRILLIKKDYPGALENFRSYLKTQPNAADAADVRRQVQTLEQAAAPATTKTPQD